MCRWDDNNLATHYARHVTKDATAMACWKDLLGCDRDVSCGQYEIASHEAIERRWLEYECAERDRQYSGFHAKRASFVDERLIRTITDLDREYIVTCFHFHSGRRHQTGYHRSTPLFELQDEYVTWLREERDGGLVKDLQVQHNASGITV